MIYISSVILYVRWWWYISSPPLLGRPLRRTSCPFRYTAETLFYSAYYLLSTSGTPWIFSVLCLVCCYNILIKHGLVLVSSPSDLVYTVMNSVPLSSPTMLRQLLCDLRSHAPLGLCIPKRALWVRRMHWLKTNSPASRSTRNALAKQTRTGQSRRWDGCLPPRRHLATVSNSMAVWCGKVLLS